MMETNSKAFIGGYVTYSIKINIKDRTIGCVSITSDFNFKWAAQGEERGIW